MSSKLNYDKRMLAALKEMGEDRKSCLLHACCGPCASYPVEELQSQIDLTLYFYNPNILSQKEYDKRLGEIDRLLEMQRTNYLAEEYNHDEFLEAAKGLETEPEGGKRCEECFRLRLKKTAEKAKEMGFDYFATTLTVSPLKNAQLLNQIGMEIAEEVGVEFLPSDFKKRNGFLRSIELSRLYGLYRQDYCGCEFSLRNEKRSKMVIVFLADGFEEIEAVTPIDLLRRAGVEVQTVGVNGKTATGRSDITISADIPIEDFEITDDIDMIVLPGGNPGYVNLENSEKVVEAIKNAVENDKYVAAICAAPSILGHLGLLEGKKATVYPGMEDELKGADVEFKEVVTDGNIITSRGAGTAIPFGAKLIEVLKGEDTAKEVLDSIVFQATP